MARDRVAPRVAPTRFLEARRAWAIVDFYTLAVMLATVADLANSTSLVKRDAAPAFVFARVCALTALAWLALSDTDNERAGGTTAAVVLAGLGCPAGPERIELAGGVLAGALYASRVERVRAHRR